MQSLVNVVQEFEVWSGIQVNTVKTKEMTVVDGIVANIQGHPTLCHSV